MNFIGAACRAFAGAQEQAGGRSAAAMRAPRRLTPPPEMAARLSPPCSGSARAAGSKTVFRAACTWTRFRGLGDVVADLDRCRTCGDAKHALRGLDPSGAEAETRAAAEERRGSDEVIHDGPGAWRRRSSAAISSALQGAGCRFQMLRRADGAGEKGGRRPFRASIGNGASEIRLGRNSRPHASRTGTPSYGARRADVRSRKAWSTRPGSGPRPWPAPDSVRFPLPTSCRAT